MGGLEDREGRGRGGSLEGSRRKVKKGSGLGSGIRQEEASPSLLRSLSVCCVLLYTDFAARCQQEHTSCEFIMEQTGQVGAILLQIVIVTYFHLIELRHF